MDVAREKKLESIKVENKNPGANQPLENAEDYELSAILYNHMKEGNHNAAHNEIRKKKHKKYLAHNSMELIPTITRVLREDFCKSNTEKCIENILLHIAVAGNQKEILLTFLEEVEIFKSDRLFRILLKPIQKIMLDKVSKSTKVATFLWVFDTLYSHIAVLKLPEDYSFEGDERKLLDCDPDVLILSQDLDLLYHFYEEFYEKVITKELVWTGVEKTTEEILALELLKYFGRPLTFLDVFCDENDTGKDYALYRTVEKYVSMIVVLLKNHHKLLDYLENIKELHKTKKARRPADYKNSDMDIDDIDDEDVNKGVTKISVATFYYCLYGQKMSLQHLSCVYSPIHIYLQCIPLCLSLLDTKIELSIHKGLLLLQGLLNRIDNSQLHPNTLDIDDHSTVPKTLVNIMILCSNKELRTISLETFRLFLHKFQPEGKHKLMCMFLRTVNHSGVQGLIIQDIKQTIVTNFRNKDVRSISAFSGAHLRELLHLSCSLPDGERSDLLEWSDKIMAALNLLIYLCLRDKNDTLSFKSTLPKLSESFLKPLVNGFRISRAHYELKLRDLKKYPNPESQKGGPEMSVTIGNEVLPDLPPEEEMMVMNNALNYFDLMQSVWARADKLVNSFI